MSKTKTPNFATSSEKYFSQYLDDLKLFWDYERAWGDKNPDFTIYRDKQKHYKLVVSDVKEFDYTEHEKKVLKEKGILVRNLDPYSKIRQIINATRKQFKHAKEYPCVAILYTAGGAPVIPLLVLAAMVGDLGISVPIERIGTGSIRKPYTFFGEGGKMIDAKHGLPQNCNRDSWSVTARSNPIGLQ